jgi:dynein heavy chain
MNIGRFIDLNAEEAERSVEKYFTAINKAAKFFNKLELKEQAETANLIKSQINRFRPEMPLLVTLRNPGMRDRHWEKVSYFCLFSLKC